MAMTQDMDPSLRKAITAANKLWDAGNKDWFDFLAKDAVIYAIGRTEPFVGRQAYEAHFGAQLTGATRKTTTVSQNVQPMDGSAVVAQTLQIVQEDITVNVRQSVIWARTDESKLGWQIKHLHTALIGNPSPTKVPKTASAIRVLNERIATMAATVGVAQ